MIKFLEDKNEELQNPEETIEEIQSSVVIEEHQLQPKQEQKQVETEKKVDKPKSKSKKTSEGKSKTSDGSKYVFFKLSEELFPLLIDIIFAGVRKLFSHITETDFLQVKKENIFVFRNLNLTVKRQSYLLLLRMVL